MTFRKGVLVAVMLAAASPVSAQTYGNMDCQDPWIAQAIYQLYRRMPQAASKTTEECDIRHYNNGRWGTYGELVGYVAKAVAPVSVYVSRTIGTPVQVGPISVTAAMFNGLPQRDVNGFKEVQLSGKWYVIAAGGGNVVAAGGGNLLSTNGGNIISSNSGSVVSAGGGNIISSNSGSVSNNRTVMSVGSSSYVAAQPGKAVALNGRNISLYPAP